MHALLEQADSPRFSLGAMTEAFALRVRQLVQRKLAELRSSLPGRLSDPGSGRTSVGVAAEESSSAVRSVLF